MGCVASRTIDNEERVQIFKERRRLMKHLLVHRGEFSDALSFYLRSLKNTGMALKQFTESEMLKIEDIPLNSRTSPPSPPPPLPPSPPPPPFSPNMKSKPHELEHETGQEESIEIDDDDDDDGRTLPPPPHPSSLWDSWGPFEPLSLQHQDKTAEHMEEDQWAETRMEFEEECAEEIVEENTPDPLPEKPHKQPVEMIVNDSSSSAFSWNKGAPDMMMMATWRGKKTLEGIVKDLDDYFLKASALGKEIAILMDINSGDAFSPQNPNKSG